MLLTTSSVVVVRLVITFRLIWFWGEMSFILIVYLLKVLGICCSCFSCLILLCLLVQFHNRLLHHLCSFQIANCPFHEITDQFHRIMNLYEILFQNLITDKSIKLLCQNLTSENCIRLCCLCLL